MCLKHLDMNLCETAAWFDC